jgi:tritrans,polycis-undecaprenyl-diphosphate synthase [geranylgeranyl-diphosphate specific]
METSDIRPTKKACLDKSSDKTIEEEDKFKKLREELKDKLPKHVGFIPDGNRRFAKKQGISRNMGHYKGYEVVKKVLINCFNAGIKYLSLYALSLENALKRPKDELAYIFKIIKLAVETVKNEPIVTEEKVRFNVIGRLELLPKDVQEKIQELVDYTKNFDKAFVNVLIMYDGQAEIVDAIKNMIKNKVDPEKIDTKLVKEYLYTKNFPEVDFIIRTGMDDGARISGFLLWDASYAEFKFRNDFWPEYNEDMLIEDIHDFIYRNRRKGQ